MGKAFYIHITVMELFVMEKQWKERRILRVS